VGEKVQSNKNMTMRFIFRLIVPAILCVIVAILVAFGIGLIYQLVPASQATAEVLIAALLFCLIVAPLVIYSLIRRKFPTPSQTGFYLLLAISLALLAIYFYWISSQVFFPSDILNSSESIFVTDLIKTAKGYPYYTPEWYNESNSYTPGGPIIAYGIAKFIGLPFFLPAYRIIHLAFIFLASVVATICINLLIDFGFPERARENRIWWNYIWFVTSFLVATNSLTNPYVHMLHHDALALLLNSLAFLWLLLYVRQRKSVYLVLMAITPALGFWVKQNLIIWAILYFGYLLIFDSPKSWKRLIVFSVTSFILLGLSISLGYLLWKGDFIYWVFTTLSKISNSPPRVLLHLFQVWPYPVIGLIAGLLLIWEYKKSKYFGLWVIWLLLFLIETSTSGIAWTLNHIGPGSLIASVWFGVSVFVLWPRLMRKPDHTGVMMEWLRIGILISCFTLFTYGLGIFRIPVDSLEKDASRYVQQIEQEFVGLPAESVLLDAGSWVYLPDLVIMQDRASSIGDRGYSGIGDFSGFLQRIQQKKYDKILLRKYLAPDNWYDNVIWPRTSGIDKALQENYQVLRVIPAVKNQDNYLFSEISVLIPK
jgi:hypothetical protein